MSSIKNLYIKFDQFELDIPELILPDKGVTAIVGSSGSGKTTFLQTMIGLHQPKNWEWTYQGEVISKLSIGERRLGVVFQAYDLFPHLSAEDNILLILRARNSEKNHDEAKNQLEQYKKVLNLASCWKTVAGNLSGGEKQRVALLRALVSNPRILLLDEPFAALDADLRSEARQMLKKVVSQLDIPVYLVTHDKEDVEFLAQHVVRMSHGKITS